MILKRPKGKWRVQVKHRGRVVADRTFVRRGDAVRWEMEQKRLALRVHIVPAFGKLPIASISSVQVERFLTDLAV